MKKTICLLLVMIVSFNLIGTTASGLYITYFEKSILITENLKYVSYVGEDSSAYSQYVHMLDFDPRGETLPIVGFGKSLLSHKTLVSMMETEKNKSGNVVAGINGDFYSFYTGIPASVVIRDGILVSTDSGNNAIGFTENGEVLIGKPDIKMTFGFVLPESEAEEIPIVSDEGTTVEISEEDISSVQTEEVTSDKINDEVLPPEEIIYDENNTTAYFEFGVHYNKYPTVYAVYLTDSNYSAKTASTFPCREIVIKTEDKLTLNASVEFEVTGIYEDASNTEIPYGSMVLSVPNTLKSSEIFGLLEVGDKLTLNISCNDGWEKVNTAVGGGDVIVDNGAFISETVNEDHEKYRNARTAVGIREDGTVFFVAVDGDGKNGSGMSFQRLAEFMIGEGAVTALNLDGGGSTTVAVTFPSKSEIEVLNFLKDGSERKISNSILFLNKSQNYQIPSIAHLPISDSFFLGGSSHELNYEFYDGQGIKMIPVSTVVQYTSSDTDTVIRDGIYFASDKSYVDRLFVSFDFGTSTLEAETVINVTDKIDNLKLNKNSVLINNGDTVEFEVTSERFGIPVITNLETLTYTVLSQSDEVSQVETSVSENLFENEYISVSKDGIITAKEAPLFTRVDLSVSYKDTGDVLSIYFGKADEILDDFDGEGWYEKIADSNKKFLSKGYRSDNSIFAPDGLVSYNAPIVFDIIPIYLTLWIKGSYQNDLVAIVESGGEQYFLPYYIYKNYSDVSGWIQLIAPVPETIKDGMRLLCPVLSESSSAITVDSVTAHYGYTTDPFEDIGGIWSHDYIMQVYDMGIINGYLEDGRLIFKPENNITRAEFAKMLASYLALDTKKYLNYGTDFADAQEIAEWSSDSIKALSNEGYMNGRSNPDGTITFDSNSYITREEAMHVFAKFIKTDDGTHTLEFGDLDSVHDWALDSVEKVVGAGVVTGFDDGTLRASAPVTRAQMCTMFTRLWNINK